MLNIVDRKLCSGCGACYNLCPVNAISMVEDNEGFKYPVIDEEKCTNCGLCTKSCPVANPKYENEKEPKCFAYMANDEIRKNSASGGAFAQLANLFIQDGGYVVGVVYTKDWGAEHIVSNKVEDIARMQSSKYFQSDMTQCYKQIKQILEEDKKVLFSGTPCQVAGLKAFLRKDYDDLYCLDLICHGVPSRKVFKKYLDETYGQENVKEYNFRSKEKNGWGSTTRVAFKDERIIDIDKFEDKYYEIFIKNIISRKSCSFCPFSKIQRQGDLSIGDFWGINDYNKKFNDKKGTSVILCNNNKGSYLLNLLGNSSKLLKETPLKYALNKNPNIYKASTIHKNRDLFYKNIDKMSFSDNYESVLGNKADCMILNLWPCVNYGASLTCYGVQCLAEKLGYSAKVINYVPQIKLKYKGSFAEDFAKKYLNLTTPIHTFEDCINLNKHCNNFIVGSDQVFNGNIMQTHASGMDKSIWLLDFVTGENKKLSYSASFGYSEMVFSEEIQSKMRYFLPQFDSISIREDDGLNILKEHFNLDAVQLIDGAFHIPTEKLEEMTKKYEKKEDYIACFMLPYYQKDIWYKELLPKVQEKYNLPIKYFDFKANTSVEEWLSFIKNSSFVITDSYHSVIFSVIFEKNFIHIKKAKTQSRFASLYRLLGFENLSIDESSNNIEMEKLFEPKDFSKAKKNIAKEIEKAEFWLKNAIEQPKKDNSKYEISNQIIQNQLFKTNDLEKRLNLIAQKEEIKKKYYTAKVLSKITFGKMRKKYKELKNRLKPIHKQMRQHSKFNFEYFE